MFLRLQPSVIPAFIRAVFRIAVEVLDRFCQNGLLGNKIEAIFVSFFRLWTKILVKAVKFSSIDENLVKNRDIFGYARKKCFFCTKNQV